MIEKIVNLLERNYDIKLIDTSNKNTLFVVFYHSFGSNTIKGLFKYFKEDYKDWISEWRVEAYSNKTVMVRMFFMEKVG